MKVIIVGGVAGGASTAARLRRLDESAQIILLERGGAVSYSNCGLPYYIGGVVQNRDDLLLQTPQSFWDRFHVEVRIFSEAVSVDPAAKTVRIRRTDSGEAYTESYDKLVLAPGAEPLVPPIPGGSNAYTLRTIEDAARIKEAAAAGGARKAVVVGGGFIGLEMAENLREAGLDVVVAEGSDQLLPPLDPEMAAIAARELERNGIQVLLQNPVKEIRPSGGGYQVLCGSQILPCDFAVMAIGVRPESTLAVQSGLKALWWTRCCAPRLPTYLPPATRSKNTTWSHGSPLCSLWPGRPTGRAGSSRIICPVWSIPLTASSAPRSANSFT